MRKSDDLNDAVARVFEELDKLNIGILRCGIGILNKEKRCAEVWTTTIAEQGRIIQVSGDESMDIHPLLAGAFEAWLRKGDFTYVLEGDDMSDYYSAVMKTNFHLPASQILVEHAEELKHYYYGTAFESGMLFAFRETAFSDEAKAVMKRFAGVFNLTYKRFLDIQNAEALALKAQIEEQKLREEKKRSDSLLLNILPEEIANELKQFGKSYARKHEEVTILFADIKGFSSIAENLSADELVTQLDECFRAFDKIVEKHGLEKIKTVGDAYVCACGLPKPVADHAVKTVGAALDMIEFIKGFGMTKKIQNLPAFEFRVGIHTGPVVTGVVGLKKFTYDIWGDAVNMAARMEQHGEAGRINVSGTTYQFIKDKFKCIHRGRIEAKNKGEVDMYFVETAG
jgi:class 3 adenylate cyclase